jgi:hypothetical protein
MEQVASVTTSDGSKAWWATEVMARRNILLLTRFQQRLSSPLSMGLSLHASTVHALHKRELSPSRSGRLTPHEILPSGHR